MKRGKQLRKRSNFYIYDIMLGTNLSEFCSDNLRKLDGGAIGWYKKYYDKLNHFYTTLDRDRQIDTQMSCSSMYHTMQGTAWVSQCTQPLCWTVKGSHWVCRSMSLTDSVGRQSTFSSLHCCAISSRPISTNTQTDIHLM